MGTGVPQGRKVRSQLVYFCKRYAFFCQGLLVTVTQLLFLVWGIKERMTKA